MEWFGLWHQICCLSYILQIILPVIQRYHNLYYDIRSATSFTSFRSSYLLFRDVRICLMTSDLLPLLHPSDHPTCYSEMWEFVLWHQICCLFYILQIILPVIQRCENLSYDIRSAASLTSFRSSYLLFRDVRICLLTSDLLPLLHPSDHPTFYSEIWEFVLWYQIYYLSNIVHFKILPTWIGRNTKPWLFKLFYVFKIILCLLKLFYVNYLL